ncbi:ATP-dependent zinc metalloprotease FtsH [Clostridium tyrobutyricum]|uniref:ATP-dependent zinc metalloprotease FtsH n=1 Tax=Clostridium tyrobutyricum TaxID=1519 RepID=UPI001C38BCD5|nr:ATP-dependent zinc metalloprotease FtsH [Clostridium tyrobutyricum]MBV4417892.1 ATP-dependent zinc metalloprotease FtsH [Clostridium tyrobutyricum]
MLNNKKFNGNKWKYTIYYALAVVVIIFILNDYISGTKSQHIQYSDFMNYVNQNKVAEVQISRDKLMIIPKQDSSGKILYTERINDPDLVEKLDKAKVKYGGIPQENSAVKNFFTVWVIPIIILGLMWRLFLGIFGKKMGSGVMSFGKNTAKIYAENETGVNFGDVAGQEEAKESLVEIVDFLHNSQKYVAIGAKLPKGALLVGPPGTGKTLLAKAVAGEAKVPFFSISGSGFVEMFVGMGAARVRDLFKQAQEKAPCIVFIDEIDAIGKSRDGNISGGNDEREQTLNQLLAEMDGFDSSKGGVVILAATNRPEVLDKALLRPGRFDRRVIVDRPDLKGREEILKVHIKGVRVSTDVDLNDIAKATPGAVGADLANMINEAALRAVKDGRMSVKQEDLEEAVEVIIAGKEKKDRILSSGEKQKVAFHEVGHALIAALLKHTDPVHKITIVPRTMGALGYTMQLPEEEKYLNTKQEMLDKISVMLGGRSAEEVKFNSISTGAANDIERATQMARSMVTMYGMTDRFDMMGLESMQNKYLDGRPVQNCSAQTSAIIDEETLNIIKKCHEDAVSILENNMNLLEEISNLLIEKETLMGDEFMDIVKNHKQELPLNSD